MKKVDKLLPCDIESPFIFISYSSRDRDIVYRDVSELQKRGFNIWIDEANLDKTKPSWKDDALKTIENYECQLVLLYLGEDTLLSENCLNELRHTKNELTYLSHINKQVGVLVVEAQPIDSIDEIKAKSQIQIENFPCNSQEKTAKARVLATFINEFFPNNEKVRLKAQKNEETFQEYINRIEEELYRNTQNKNIKLNQDEIFRRAVNLISQDDYRIAIDLLEINSKRNHIESQLLLSHLYFSPYYNFQNMTKVKSLWEKTKSLVNPVLWSSYGDNWRNQGDFEKALAYYLAYGDFFNDGLTYRKTASLWMVLKSKNNTLADLYQAKKLGVENIDGFISKIETFSEQSFEEFASQFINNERK